jgi:hypothetical protein
MFFSATSVLAAAVVFNAASSMAAVVPITGSSAVAREVTPDVEVREVPADLLITREDMEDDLLTREDIEDDLFARDEVTDVESRGWHKHAAAKEPAPVIHDMKKLQHTQPKFLVTGRVKKWHRVHKWKHVFAAAHKGCNKNNKDKKAHNKNNEELIVTMFKYNMPGKVYKVTNQQQWEKVLKAAKGHPILISTVNPQQAAPAANNNKKQNNAVKPKGKRDLEDELEMFTRDFEDDENMFAREFDDDVYTRSFESIADLD